MSSDKGVTRHALQRFITTDNPADPCAYDVHWEESKGDPDEAIPYIRPGVKAKRLYRWIHDDCEKAVMQYIAESRS